MRIKLVLINEEHLTTVKEKTTMLDKALMLGEIGKTDLIAEELFFLLRKEPAVSLEETKWSHILHEVRKIYSDYRADFILEEEDISKLSETKLDSSFKGFLELVKMALEQKRRILQIPYDEEDGNV